jgi:hypothetical protein
MDWLIKLKNGCFLVIGIIGVLICQASVILLGIDITAYVNSGFILGGMFKLTNVLLVFNHWAPLLWTEIVNYMNTAPVSLQKTFLEFFVTLPATLVGLIIGFGLIYLGFRVGKFGRE